MDCPLRYVAALALLALPAVLVPIAACTSTSPAETSTPDAGQQAPKGDANAGDAAEDAKGMGPPTNADCGALTLLLPVLAVVNAATGSSVCDPTVAQLLPGDAGLDPLTYSDCPTPQAPACPSPLADGAPPPCALALDLTGLGTIEVSAPGFETVSVPNVTSGWGACGNVPASVVAVQLSPLPDGGADGSIDASDDAAD